MKNFIYGLLAIIGVVVFIPLIPAIWHVLCFAGICYLGCQFVCWVGKKIGGVK